MLLREQESIKEDYQMLIRKFEYVEKELKLRMMMDSLINDSIYTETSTDNP
jgi:hypothetical protein